MYDWLNNLYQNIMFFFYLIKPIIRLSMGRLHVWRDTPTWVVEWVASLDPDLLPDVSEFDLKAILTANEEMKLRLERLLKEVEDEIARETEKRG